MQEIAVIGAGIGGLTTAHALRQAGLKVRIFERSKELRAAGAGITMQANAMMALASLVLAESVREVGQEIRLAKIATWKGKTLQAMDFGSSGLLGVALHRRRLVETLADGLEDVLEFGAPVEHVENTGGALALHLGDGSEREFAALIGCDGLHSAVRRSLKGEEPLRYAGYTTWRGVANMPTRGMDTVEFWGPGKRFGIVPIYDDEVYWFAVAEAPQGQVVEGPVLEHLQALFQGWDPQVAEALDATAQAVIATDIFDRPPAKSWGEGRVTLLGDAAHPMTPNLGQGGCQAVEDAVVLGRVLEQVKDIEEGLRKYERMRMKRANSFVRRSYQAGKVAQWDNPLARSMRDLGVRLTPKNLVRRQLQAQYDFEAWFQRAGENTV